MSGFEQFWSIYPNKKAKKDAKTAWDKLGCDQMIEAIMQAVEKQSRTIWSGEKARFVPLPATWIRGERWQDEVGPIQTTTSKPQPSQFQPEPMKPRHVRAANLFLLNFLRNCHGVSEAQLELLLAEKKRMEADLDRLIRIGADMSKVPRRAAERFAQAIT
jgi:hypothetical protein